jgi:hypothetical protein
VSCLNVFFFGVRMTTGVGSEHRRRSSYLPPCIYLRMTSFVSTSRSRSSYARSLTQDSLSSPGGYQTVSGFPNLPKPLACSYRLWYHQGTSLLCVMLHRFTIPLCVDSTRGQYTTAFTQKMAQSSHTTLSTTMIHSSAAFFQDISPLPILEYQ